ncbi:MAG: 1-acyl-sn-glycerol-3-phosphate acyltransferase [Candidatus Cloacimonetes bacterium]|nr:1-acyl-sn-glycerol-3-phosphate acyltransferase [Candidatus Cloacimonadota bacterium]
MFKIIMKTVGNYRIVHKERLADWNTCIIAANHISYFDPPFIGSILPQEIYYLAKYELFKNPIFGSILRFVNSIPVKRGVFDRKTIDRLKELLSQNKSILIFPEGSRKSFTAKPGIGILVHEMKVPILPIHIENSNNIKDCLIRKKRISIYIGERIEPEKYDDLPAEKKTYRQIADDILKTINRLPYDS